MTIKEKISEVFDYVGCNTNEKWREIHWFFNRQTYSPRLNYNVYVRDRDILVENNVTGDYIEVSYF